MSKTIKCPFCQLVMKVDQFYGNEIERCPNCKEIWFDNNELMKAINKMGYDSTEFINKFKVLPKVNHSPVYCPVCTKHMLEFYKWDNSLFGFCKKCNGIIISHSKVNTINKTLPVLNKNTESIDWLDAVLNGLIFNLDKLIN